MKKLAALFLAILMIFSFVACGETNVDSPPDEQKTNQPQSTTAPGREYDETDPAAVLGEITNDFADVTTSLTLKLEETFTAVGTTDVSSTLASCVRGAKVGKTSSTIFGSSILTEL